MTSKTETSAPYSAESKKTFDSQGDDTSAINVPARTTGLLGAVFNLTKSAVGAGTVYLPAIFYMAGPAIATSLLLSGALLCAVPLYFLGRMAHHCETGDYFKLGRLAMGQKGETAVSVSLLLFLIGGLIAYASLTGEFVSSAAASLGEYKVADSFFTARNVTVIAAVCCIFPLSLLKDMSMLAKTSILGMASMLYIASLLAYDALTYGSSIGIASGDASGDTDPATKTAYEFAFMMCGFIGKLVFAFVNHFTIVSLVPVMKDPSAKSRMTLLTASTLIATVIYVLAAYGGYSRFGSLLIVDGSPVNALSAFTGEIPLPYIIAKLLLGFVLICSFPLLCDPARSCLDSLIFGASSTISATARHYSETALIVAVPTAIAYFCAKEADDFLSFFSGVCGSLLVFTFPGAFFVILSRKFKFSMSPVEKALAYFCVGLGIVLAVLSSIANGGKLISMFSFSKPVVA